MTGFVYKWTNLINGKWYIGSRKGTTHDGYRHTSQIMKLAEEKYGLENFTREILFEGDYDKDQIRAVKEAEYLQEEDAANNPMSYNRTNITGPNCYSEETIQKRIKSRLGKSTKPRDKIARENIAKGMIGNTNGQGNKGKKHIFSKEHCQNISKGKKGKKLAPLSAKHKKKLSKALKGKPWSIARREAYERTKK